MKQGKLLILLVLILSMSVFAFACGNDPEPSEPADTGSETEATVEEQPAQEVKHEIHDYLILEVEKDGYDFSEVSQYEGEVVDYDRQHGLLAIKTQNLNEKNEVTDTITIYDLLTGEVIQTYNATYPLYANLKESVSLQVNIDYPIVRVKRTTYSENSDGEYEDKYDVKYYFAKKGSELIRSTDKNNYSRVDYGNGLVSFDMGDEVVWIDRYMNELRSVKSIAANGYDIDVFDSEYQGYLYAWNAKTVQIFNRLGVCSGIYTMEAKGRMNVNVLDDGNVLIQELEYVDSSTPYDFIMSDGTGATQRVKVNSFVMSYLDGTMTAVDLDFVVEDLETEYSERYSNSDYDYLPFALVAGHDNQAIIYRFSAGKLSLYSEYVVMTNALEIEYTVNNKTPGVQMAYASSVGAELYAAPVVEGSGWQNYIFDLDGNKVSPLFLTSAEVTEDYVITDTGIYDLQMNLLYDLTAGEFARAEVEVDVFANVIYFIKHNFETDAEECYIFDVETKQATLLCDGKTNMFKYCGTGFYVLYNTKTETHDFYGVDGEIKMSLYSVERLNNYDDMLVVYSMFEGKQITYVVK